MKKTIIAGLAAALTLGSSAALAAGHNQSYNFFQLTYADATADLGSGVDLDVSGVGLTGSFEVGDTAFVAVNYSPLGGDVMGTDVDVNQTRIGFGGAWALNDTTDFYGAISYLKADVEIEGFGSEDDNGYGIDLGFRGQVSKAVELFGSINYVDVFDGNDTGFSAGARFVTSDTFSIVVAYQTADDIDGFNLGGRFEF